MSWKTHKSWASLITDDVCQLTYTHDFHEAQLFNLSKYDWSTADAKIMPYLYKDTEVAGTLEPTKDRNLKPKNINTKGCKTSKNHIYAPDVNVPDIIHFHTHPLTHMVVPYPSMIDLVECVISFAKQQYVWNVVYCKYGKFVYRPSGSLSASIITGKIGFRDFIKKMESAKGILFSKGMTPTKFIKFLKEFGYIADFIPYADPIKGVDIKESYKFDQKESIVHRYSAFFKF